ncbi:MAG: hypothetical protein NVSMB6_23820 [Burkholderiaceae bacterium]
MVIFWGDALTCFYNDAFSHSIGPERHPQALGCNGQDVWAEVWDVISPQIDQVMAGGGGTWHENQLVPITRNGKQETVYWTYSYGPIDDEQAETGVGGVLVVCSETTQTVLAKQRYQFLSELGDHLRTVTNPHLAMLKAAEMLGQYLQADCVGYSEVDGTGEYADIVRSWTRELFPAIVGRYRLDAYGVPVVARLRAGHSVQVHDITSNALMADAEPLSAFPGTSTQAFIIVPVFKEHRLEGILFVLNSVKREWMPDDVKLVEEVTERIWATIERARAEDELRTANRRKDEFLAILAHELRNPLAPISGAAQLLMVADLDKDRIKKTGGIIARQVEHMTGLVNDLLDISRVTSGLIVLEKKSVDVNRVIEAALEQVRPHIDAKRHQLVTQITPQAMLVHGEEKRLVQVVANLLHNAAKYTPEAGEIVIRADVNNNQVIVDVSDNGIGIVAGLLPTVFELFAQAERRSDRAHGGLGLGLALVKSVVQLHEGTVSAQSRGLGMGSSFSVHLPLFAEKDAVVEAKSDRNYAMPISQKQLDLLVVDDNVDAAQSLAMYLEAVGHRVTVAHDSKAALARAENDVFDAYLLDIGMPGLDGNELVRRLRAKSEAAQALIIAISGYGHSADRDISIEAGFDEYLVKPADPDMVASLLASIKNTYN